jgi:hypothetical protein
MVGHCGCGGQVQPLLIASFEAGSGPRKSDRRVSSRRRISVIVRSEFLELVRHKCLISPDISPIPNHIDSV